MKIIAIIQARMGSSRLPGKVLKEVLDKPLLQYQIERMEKSKYINKIVIATTLKDSENPLVELANRMGISVFRGSEDDVLERYYYCASEYDADIIVRITSDCPCIDPQVIDEVIEYYINHTYQYVSNTIIRSFPRGMDTEVFPYYVLKEAFEQAKLPFEREHVTPYIYNTANKFTLGNVMHNDEDYSFHRWTVDTVEDMRLIKLIIENLYPIKPMFYLQDIIDLLQQNPGWLNINQHIEQKKLGI